MGLFDKILHYGGKILPFVGMASDIIGQSNTNRINEDISAQNMALQKEFAKNSISWRVNDARKAGIHPLAALGVTPFNYQPQFIGNRKDPMSALGQNIARYAEAMETDADKRLKNARAAVLEKEANGVPGAIQVGDDGVAKIAQSDQSMDVDSGVVGRRKIKNVSVKFPGLAEYNTVQLPVKTSEGVSAGFPAMKMWSPDEYGWYRLQLTREVSESLESDWFANASNFFLEGLRTKNSLWYEMEPDRPAAKKWRQMMRKLRDSTLPDPGEGAEWAWRGWPYNGFKKRVKNGPRGHFYWKWKGRNAEHIVN